MATKKTGMMEIAFTNGIVRADAKTGRIELSSIEKMVGKSREDIFGEHLEGVKYLMFGDMIDSDVIAIFQEDLKITDSDMENLVDIVKNKVIEDNYISKPIKNAVDRSNSKNELKGNDVGVVYLFGASGKLKIGKTKNVKQRLKCLQIGCPDSIECLHVIYTDKCTELEKFLHNKFSKFRSNGEWFKYDESIVLYFKNL